MGTRTWTGWIVALACAGCWSSHGRTDAPDAVADSTTPDAYTDTSTDAAVETDVPPYTCLYEREGERQLADPPHETDAPSAFWTGDRVAVVLFESGGDMPHPYVSLTSVEPDLSDNTDLLVVGEESHGWGETAWTGEEFGLCWHTDPGMVGRTAFRLHRADGGRAGSRVDLDMDGEACVGLVWGGERFLAAWRHSAWVDDEYFIDSRIQVLDAAGVPVGDPHDLVRGEYPGRTPSLCPVGERFLVALAGEDEILLWWIDPGGDLEDAGSIEAEDVGYVRIAEHEGRYALAWLTGERDARGLRFAILDDGFHPVGAERVLVTDGTGASSPRPIPVDDGWVITWHEGETYGGRALLLHTDADGIPREPRHEIHLGRNSSYGGPSPVAHGDDLWVAISWMPVPEWWEQVHLVRYRCEEGSMDVCAPQDAVIDPACDDPESLGWKWDGAGCVEIVACPEECSGDDCHRLSATRWDCVSDRSHCT